MLLWWPLPAVLSRSMQPALYLVVHGIPRHPMAWIPWHPMASHLKGSRGGSWNAEQKWEGGAVASYSFSPGSEGSVWLFSMGELWAEVRWGLGRDRAPKLSPDGMDAVRESRYPYCKAWTGILQMREMWLLWVFLLALMSWNWTKTFFFLFASATHGERQWVDCRWWLLQSKVLGRTDMQEK